MSDKKYGTSAVGPILGAFVGGVVFLGGTAFLARKGYKAIMDRKTTHVKAQPTTEAPELSQTQQKLLNRDFYPVPQ